jgi:hypothetical protein
MSTSVNVNAPSSPQVQTRAYAKGGTRAAIAVLIALGLVFLVSEVAGAIHLSSPVGSAEELGEDAGQFFVGP